MKSTVLSGCFACFRIIPEDLISTLNPKPFWGTLENYFAVGACLFDNGTNVFWQNVLWIYCRRFQTAIFMVVVAEFVVRYLVYLVAQKRETFSIKKIVWFWSLFKELFQLSSSQP
jgi:hypothetical protein